MLTPKGGIECDLTVTRVDPERFYLISAAATELHDYAWIQRHLPDDGSVQLENVTTRNAVLTLAGPQSQELLQRLTSADLSREAFPFFHAREIDVDGLAVRALRLSYVGELGFELHHPIEHLHRLYDVLFEAGRDLGLVDFGYRALESMRLEKAYRLWGADMSADYTPPEAGLERFVKLDKGDFIGRDALLRQAEESVRRRLACLIVDTDGADAHGYEPILADRRPIAYIASGGYGHTLGCSIALAYLPVEHAEVGTRLAVEVLGESRPAEVAPQPLYDPANERLLA